MPIYPKTYVTLLNYKGWKDTIECLESLFQMGYSNMQAIVVDNNSPNKSIAHLLEWAKGYFKNESAYLLLDENLEFENHRVSLADVIFIKSERNAGFAAGNNLAIKFALKRGDFKFLWLLNNDTTVAPNSLSELVDRAILDIKNDINIGIWGSKILYYSNPSTIQAIGAKFDKIRFTTSHIAENKPDGPEYNVTSIEQDYVVGASMFVSRDFIEKIGLLCEDYFLYFEELDWATRGLQKGYSLGYVWSSRVYHKEGQTIGSNSAGSKKSELADYHGIRSKIIFIKKFYPEKLLQLYTLLVGSAILRVGRLQFKRAKNVLTLMVKI